MFDNDGARCVWLDEMPQRMPSSDMVVKTTVVDDVEDSVVNSVVKATVNSDGNDSVVKATLQQLEQQCVALTTALRNKQPSTNDDLAKYRSELSDIAAQRDSLQTERDEFQRQLLDSQAQLADVKQQLGALDASNDRLIAANERVAELTDEIDALKLSHSEDVDRLQREWQEQLQTVVDERDQLGVALATAQQSNDDSEQLHRLQSEIDQLTERLKESEDVAKQRNDALATKQTTIDEQTSRLSALQSELDNGAKIFGVFQFSNYPFQ